MKDTMGKLCRGGGAIKDTRVTCQGRGWAVVETMGHLLRDYWYLDKGGGL